MDSRRRPSGRRRRRRQRRRLAVILAGSVLVVIALIILTVVYPPAFLSTASDRKPTPHPSSSVPSSPATTPAETGKVEARLAIVGDTGTRNAAQDATARRMELTAQKDGPYDGLIILGDIIYPNGDAALARQSVTIPFAPVLKTAELIPALGNHDIQSDEQVELMHALGRDSNWYVQRVGPVRVIVLDSNHVSNPEQMAWLRKVLAEKQPAGTWTIAAMHHPAYSAGDHGSTKNVQQQWVPLFEKANVPLVLAGHDHDYERVKPQHGILYIVSGGGAKLREVGRKSFTAVSATILHFVDLVVYDDRLVGRAIDQAGNVFDEWTIQR